MENYLEKYLHLWGVKSLHLAIHSLCITEQPNN